MNLHDPAFIERQCGSKRRFENQSQAEDAARRLKKLKKKKFNAYQCLAFPDHWHIGSHRSPKSAVRRAQMLGRDVTTRRDGPYKRDDE